LRVGRVTLIAAVAVAAMAVMPRTTLAQVGDPGASLARAGGWNPTVGARTGWLTKDQSLSLGVFLHVPIPRVVWGPALVVAGDAVFQDNGLVERQATIDLTAEVLQGIYAGGGPAVLSTFFEEEGVTQETKAGYTLVAGLRGKIGLLASHLEVRWVQVDSRKLQFFMFGLSYPILGGP
jgi:hypothetical protein